MNAEQGDDTEALVYFLESCRRVHENDTRRVELKGPLGLSTQCSVCRIPGHVTVAGGGELRFARPLQRSGEVVSEHDIVDSAM